MPTTPPPILQPPSTLGPPPKPKDVPYWGAIVIALITALVSVAGTIYAYKKEASTGAPVGIGSLITDSVLFLPHILILFGVFADIFTLQGAYSIPSLVGLCAIPINWVFGMVLSVVGEVFVKLLEIWNSRPAAAAAAAAVAADRAQAAALFGQGTTQRGGAMSGWDGCEIKGFEGLKSEYAPQGLVVTATIFWYYLLDLLMNRDPVDSSITWVAFILFFGLQAWQLASCTNMASSFLIKTFISLAEGFIIGGTGYGIVQATIPTRLPSAVLPQGPNLSSLTRQENGTYTDSAGASYIVGPDGRPVAVSFIQAATGQT